MRRLWITITIALLLLTAPVLALRSPTVVLSLAHWAIGTFTDLRLEIKNPVLQLDRGLFSADELHLIPRDSAGPALFSVLGLEARTNLADILSRILRNSTLSATQVLIYVSDSDEASDPQPNSWMQLTTWLPGQLDIGQVHLITATENTWIFPLGQLRGKRVDDNLFRASAMADYEGEPLQASLEILGGQKDGQVQRVELDARFKAPESGSLVTLTGILEGNDERFHFDFLASANYRDIGDFIRGLDSSTALQGALELEARMIGDASSFTLSNASMTLDNMPDYGFEATGELHYSRTGDSRLQLIAAGEMSNLDYLVNWIDLDVTQLGRARASVQLSGTLENPMVEDFLLITESDEGLAVNVSGRLQSLNVPTAKPAEADRESNVIRVDVHGPSLSTLERWVGEVAWDPGPWRASWITRGDRETIQLENIILESGNREDLKLRVEGHIAAISNTATIGLSAIDGINLNLQAYTADSAHLARLTGMDLPPYHEIKANLELLGSGELLQISSGALEVDSSDLQARASAISGKIRPEGSAPGIDDLSAEIAISISDTGMLSQYTNREIPILGPAKLSATLEQQDKLFQLAKIDLRVDGEDLALNARGSIGDLEELRQVDLLTSVSGMDIKRLLATVKEDFEYQPPLGELAADFRLLERNGLWKIEDLALGTTAPDGPVEISARGSIRDLTGFMTADLEAQLALNDSLLLEALSGLRIKPLRSSLSVHSSPGVLDVKASARAGQTALDVIATLAHDDNGLTGVQAEFTTPHLLLADLGLQASEDATDGYAPAAELEAEPSSQLEKLLDNSPGYPTDIKILAEGISGEYTSIEGLDIHVTGDDNRYTLRRFNLVYDNALAEIRGIVDLNPSPPYISLAGQAVDVPLSSLSRDLGAPSDIRGRMTARGGITAAGKDTDALTASLNGSLAVALEDTIIQGAAYDVLATDLLAWIYSGAVMETSTHLDCSMARFDVNNGVAVTDSIYVESARMIATGAGRFDLPRQKMDLTITPRSRSRSFQIPSEVRLKGDFSDPRATISPISAAADASAQALLLIPKLAMRLFGRGSSQSQEGVQPCHASLGN